MSTVYDWSHLFPGERPVTATPDYGLHPPNSESEILRLEKRLGAILPPSYRRFLQFSDGHGDDETGLYRAARVGWLRDEDPGVIEAWSTPRGEQPSVPDELYFVYGRRQDCIHIRGEYLPDMLLIGYGDDGEFLLNPHVRTSEGEWEAWYLAPWKPGADRYRTFWDFVAHEFRSGA